MIEKFNHSGDFYRVTACVHPEKTQPMIDAAVALGVPRVFIVRGRGMMHKKKIGFINVAGLSPSFDILNLLVPAKTLNSVLNTLVKVGGLDHFGAGSIFASKLHDTWFNSPTLFAGEIPAGHAQAEYPFQKDLVAISCICQLNHAEHIADSAMAAGSPAPTICFGYGHGIRDRLGFFLQLTINPKKEFVELVVGSTEAERVFEDMIVSGRLDQPAQGFIYTRHVDVGLINTMSFENTSPYPATMEQIIKAIDQMQGNTKWRSTGTVKSAAVRQRKKLLNLISLNCIVRRGFGDACSMVAMEAGAGGTSTYFANASPMEKTEGDDLGGTDEREIISLTIGEKQVTPVVSAIAAMKELSGTPVILFASPAPQAVTYLK